MGYADQNQIAKIFALLIESCFNTANLDMTKQGSVSRSYLAPSDWLAFQGGLHLVLRAGASGFLTADTRGLNGAKVGS